MPQWFFDYILGRRDAFSCVLGHVLSRTYWGKHCADYKPQYLNVSAAELAKRYNLTERAVRGAVAEAQHLKVLSADRNGRGYSLRAWPENFARIPKPEPRTLDLEKAREEQKADRCPKGVLIKGCPQPDEPGSRVPVRGPKPNKPQTNTRAKRAELDELQQGLERWLLKPLGKVPDAEIVRKIHDALGGAPLPYLFRLIDKKLPEIKSYGLVSEHLAPQARAAWEAEQRIEAAKRPAPAKPMAEWTHKEQIARIRVLLGLTSPDMAGHAQYEEWREDLRKNWERYPKLMAEARGT
jgi:hypothetical protein